MQHPFVQKERSSMHLFTRECCLGRDDALVSIFCTL